VILKLASYELPDQVFGEGETKPVKPVKKKKVGGAKRTSDAAGIDEVSPHQSKTTRSLPRISTGSADVKRRKGRELEQGTIIDVSTATLVQQFAV
jgi:hypothetical protein